MDDFPPLKLLFSTTKKIADNHINQFLEITQPAQTTSKKKLTVAIAYAGGYIGRWFSVPVFSLGLSKFWAGLFGDSPPQLVSPLVESLKHTLAVSPELRLREKEIDYLNYEESVDEALHSKEKPLLPSFHSVKGVKNTVRSIRMPNKNRHSDLWVANRYTIWLPSFFRFLINGKTNERGDLGFYLLWGKKPMLH